MLYAYPLEKIAHFQDWKCDRQKSKLEMWWTKILFGKVNQKSSLDFCWIHFQSWICEWHFQLGYLMITFPYRQRNWKWVIFSGVHAYRVWWIDMLKHILTWVENYAIARLIMELRQWDKAFWIAKSPHTHLISTDVTTSFIIMRQSPANAWKKLAFS